ncbi:MAG: hypothetical protein CL609_04935 [Anaerolineaceae bacterium]|nr:hypothetical protein [Anaerolineaceae bacterium]
MSETSYRPTSGRAIILGIIAFIILLSIFCGLSEVLKTVGSPFLLIPQQLNIIPKVTRADVMEFEMRQSPVEVQLERTGEYAVYTKDIDLLIITDQILEAQGNPWFNLIDQSTGEKLDVKFVKRGLIPFDSSLVKGRPVYIFDITHPGNYQFSFPRRYATIYVLPDNIVGNESTVFVFVVIQLVILAFPISYFIRKLIHKRQEKLSEIRNLKKTNDSQFWEELKKQKERQNGKPNSNVGNKKY